MKFIKKTNKVFNKLEDSSYEPIIGLALKKIEKNALDSWKIEDGTCGLSSPAIMEKVSKNCYVLGKKSENAIMVCINGSNKSKLAFEQAIKEVGPNDHLILITIRDLSDGDRRYSLVARWRLMVAAKQILSEYQERLSKINENGDDDNKYNYTLIYPEVHKKLPEAIATWAKKMRANQIFLGTNKDLEKYLRKKSTAKIRTFD